MSRSPGLDSGREIGFSEVRRYEIAVAARLRPAPCRKDPNAALRAPGSFPAQGSGVSRDGEHSLVIGRIYPISVSCVGIGSDDFESSQPVDTRGRAAPVWEPWGGPAA
jgi:hypothetical protein